MSFSESALDYEFHTVARCDEIPEGSGQAFDVGERRVAVFNDGGEFFAIDDMCPHMGASLAAGHLENHVVACPLHAWRFDVRDGTWCDNRRVKIAAFPIQIVEGEIRVGVPKASKKAD